MPSLALSPGRSGEDPRPRRAQRGDRRVSAAGPDEGRWRLLSERTRHPEVCVASVEYGHIRRWSARLLLGRAIAALVPVEPGYERSVPMHVA
jgi:hypothetical protein